MISKELSATLGFAVREAKKRRHEYVSVEHILFAILYDQTGIEIIENCGGNVENIIEQHRELFPGKDREDSRRQRVRAAADHRVPAGHPARREPRPLGRQDRSLGERHPGVHFPREGFACRVFSERRGRHPAGRAQLHLAQNPQELLPGARGGPAGPRSPAARSGAAARTTRWRCTPRISCARPSRASWTR